MKYIVTIVVLILSLNLTSEIEAKIRYKDMVSFQPFGFLFLWSNVEYERHIGTTNRMAFTIAGRINFTTQEFGFGLVEDTRAEEMYGLGVSGRFYFNKDMRNLYLGVNIDYLNSDDEEFDLNRFSFEMGYKFLFTKKSRGFCIIPSTGISQFFGNNNARFFYLFGIGLGYQF